MPKRYMTTVVSGAATSRLPVWSTKDEVAISDVTLFSGGGFVGVGHRAGPCNAGSQLNGRNATPTGCVINVVPPPSRGQTTPSPGDIELTRSATLSVGFGAVLARKYHQLIDWMSDMVSSELTSSCDSVTSDARGRIDEFLVSDADVSDSCPAAKPPESFPDPVPASGGSITVCGTADLPLPRCGQANDASAAEYGRRAASDAALTGREASASPKRRSGRVCSSCNHRNRTNAAYCSDCGSSCGEDDAGPGGRTGIGGGDCGPRIHNNRQNGERRGGEQRKCNVRPWTGISRSLSRLWDYIKEEVLASSSSSGMDSDDTDGGATDGMHPPTRRTSARRRRDSSSMSRSPTRLDHCSPYRHNSPHHRVTRKASSRRHRSGSRCVPL